VDLFGVDCQVRRQRSAYRGQYPLVYLININIADVGTTLNLGPVLVPESPAPILDSHPPRTPSEVGADISKLICLRHKLKNCFVW
jgi:hypothetical protein